MKVTLMEKQQVLRNGDVVELQFRTLAPSYCITTTDNLVDLDSGIDRYSGSGYKANNTDDVLRLLHNEVASENSIVGFRILERNEFDILIKQKGLDA